MNCLPTVISSIVADCTEAIVCKTLDGTIIAWNPAAELLFGYRESEALGQSVKMLIPVELGQEEAGVITSLARGITIKALRTYRLNKNGERVAVNITLSPLRDAQGRVTGAAALMRKADSVAMIWTDEQLIEMAFHDPLTNLSNRNHLKERLQQALRRDKRTPQYHALLFIDLDDFKCINDRAGHLIGDRILIQAAQRLKHHVRDYDTVVRWGGDEFVVLIEDLGEKHASALHHAQTVARNLLRVLRRAYHCDSLRFYCPPSIGVISFSTSADHNEVLSRADAAMYHAKRAGKNGLYVGAEEAHLRPAPSVSLSKSLAV